MATPIDYSRGIRCGHCKERHPSVNQVRWCGTGARSYPAPVAPVRPVLATQAELDAADREWKARAAERERLEEAAVYRRQVREGTV